MQKIVCIVGPTAVGKTALALKIAKKFNGVLINADSIQVFNGLDIISGKDKPTDTSLTPLLTDILSPSQTFSSFEFSKKANKIIPQIISSKKLPIVVGGTGLYVRSLIEGFDSSTDPDLMLRKKLEKLTVLELQKLLPNVKLKTLNVSDINNKRRLIRAIEINRQETKDGSKKLKIPEIKQFESLVIGLYCQRDLLKQRIDNRVNVRLKNGALKEAEKLFENYGGLSPQIKTANGYKQLFQYLKNELSLEEAIYRWKISEYRHAKNQMTWFKKYGDVNWFDIEENNFKAKIEKKVKKFIVP